MLHSNDDDYHDAAATTLGPTNGNSPRLGANSKNSASSLLLFPELVGKQSMIGYNNKLAASLSNQSNIIDTTANQSQQQAAQAKDGLSWLLQSSYGLFAHLDWLFMIGSSLAGLWFLFIVGSACLTRQRKSFKFGSPRHHGGDEDDVAGAGWRFNSASRSNDSNNETGGVVPSFANSKVCVNYYGGSNGDSEHEMIQSGSQSSHYEDFVHHQMQLKQQQQQQRLVSQPVYLGGQSTLNKQQMKLSLSSSSTCDSGTNSRLGGASRKKLLAGAGSSTSASTMRGDSLGGNFANVPLVNGTNTSRVNLDHHYQQQRLYQTRAARGLSSNGLEQQLYGNGNPRNNEHIYDDVIYNQMIL